MDENKKNESLQPSVPEEAAAPSAAETSAKPTSRAVTPPTTPVSAPPVIGDDTAQTISEGEVTSMLYDQMMNVFGEGTQLFTMEMPGRVLNQLDYAYSITDHNSATLTKPYSVAENEFRLTDGMLDVAPIVQGSNGKRLSATYETLINNYTPDISDIKDFITDKMQLRLFLMETITDEIDGKSVTCSRMEFCQKMYLRYLEQKYDWDQEKIDEHLKASSNGDLDGYARWLATTSWTKDQKLENLFQDAVVRGFYHEVLTILGFLDVASPAERLADVKANNRSSVRRSLDGSMDILPVQLQPSDWFRSLSPNFSPQDLTLDPEALTREYQAKKNLLSSLEAELRILLRRNVDDTQLQNLENQLKSLKSKLAEEEEAYYKGFTDATVESMKLIFEIMSNGNIYALLGQDKTAALSMIAGFDSNFMSALGLTPEMAQQIGDVMFDLYKRNADYFETFTACVDMELALAKSQTEDYNDQISIIQERIALLSKEVSQLEVVVASGAVHTTSDGSTTDSSNTLLPQSRYNEDSEFMDIVITKTQMDNALSSDSSSFYSSVKGSIGNYFLNTNVSGEVALSETKFFKSLLSSEFKVGLRATKVTIDRGGWFDSGILELSASYRRLKDKMRGGAGLTVDSVMNAYMADDKIVKGRFDALAQLTTGPNQSTYILPSFPTAFLIVKDVVIKANMTNVVEEDYNQFKKLAYSSSSSIFGIRVSGGGASSSTCGFESRSETAATFVMRIPGPQILGWFQELLPEDKSGNYESLSKSEYFNDIIASLKDYQAKLRELQAQKLNRGDLVPMETVYVPSVPSEV